VLELKFKNHVVDLPVPQSTCFFEFSIFLLQSYRQKLPIFGQFYLKSLFFNPCQISQQDSMVQNLNGTNTVGNQRNLCIANIFILSITFITFLQISDLYTKKINYFVLGNSQCTALRGSVNT